MKISYLSVSYGLSYQLIKFWKKLKFEVFYLKQKSTASTGENTCMMALPLDSCNINFANLSAEFKRRFFQLIPFDFWTLEIQVILEVLDCMKVEEKNEEK